MTKMNNSENIETILKSRVVVKILQKLDVQEDVCMQEPAGWYREFHWVETPSVFVHYVQRNCRKFKCCGESKSSIEIDFMREDEKEFIETSQNTLDDCIKLILSNNLARDKSENLITFTRLWRGFADMTGCCVSCSYDIKQFDDITCDFCLPDNIILEEAIHYEGYWNNVGGFTFISDSFLTLSTRNILSKNETNLDYMSCILGCKPIGGIPSCPYAPSDKEVEGEKSTTTWYSMTTPRYCFLSRRFLGCLHRDNRGATSDETAFKT